MAAERSGSDTIFAVATGRGRAGIGIVRISGPAAAEALRAVAGARLPAPRQVALRDFRDRGGALIDRGLVLRFASGASYTGEEMAELHCHGGVAVLRALLARLGEVPGLRPAEPGEFTRRAFETGRIELLEVEALGDLIAAETELQRRRALGGGALVRRADGWREKLVRALALLEATIDWADEEAPENVGPEVLALIRAVGDETAAELAGAARAERLRHGFEVAILGAPNAGKSTLFNVLAGREAAITAPEPGTTRDVLELRYDLDGLPVIFLDTAGLRHSDDTVEAEGAARARARAAAADLRLFLAAPDAPLPEAELTLRQPGDVLVATKVDLGVVPGDVSISARCGSGVAALLDGIADRLGGLAGEAGLIGHERQRRALAAAAKPLARAQFQVEEGAAEVAAEELRQAVRALDVLIGRVGAEDILDRVFAEFCLGK